MRGPLRLYHSAIVGIFGVKGLHAVSLYKKHKHPDVAQQRFPDLSLNGKLNPPPNEALESKGSTRPWKLLSQFLVIDLPRAGRVFGFAHGC